MPDPFLDDHEVVPSCFDLTGRYAPASIRDQMLRASLLVQRLDERAKLAGKSVLVVGMGASGVTAGIAAARVGARVTMIEKNARPFSAQRLGASRWIDPTLYDWPLKHWQIGHCPPFPETHMPLRWSGGLAFAIQAEWLHQLREAQDALAPNLQLMYGTVFRHILLNPKSGSIGVNTASGKRTSTKRYQSRHLLPWIRRRDNHPRTICRQTILGATGRRSCSGNSDYRRGRWGFARFSHCLDR